MKVYKKLLLSMSLLILVGLVAAGCTNTQAQQNQNSQKEQVEPVDPNPSQEQVELTLYFADGEAEYIKPEARTVAKDNRSVPEIMVHELITGPREAGHNKTIPEGTELLSLEVVEGIAYVDFSKEIMTNHPRGSAGESMTVYSIVNTLGQLPEVDAVQFLIEGEKHEAIWGHAYTFEPIEPFEHIIDPEHRG